MQLHTIPRTVFKAVPPPLWYVTNGELTVGPVVTDLLRRGVEHGRVPEYCHVRALSGTWRGVTSVREIAALTSKANLTVPNASSVALDELRRPLQPIRDEDELCYTITRLSMIATGAESAMLHFVGRSARTLTTRCVMGSVSQERLGYALPEYDLVLRSARLGRPVLGPPYGPAEDALSIRFASSDGGVGGAAMVPVFMEGRLTAMLELSRPGHAFRRSDLQRAERIVQRSLCLRSN